MDKFFDLNVSGKTEELYPTAEKLGWTKIIKPALISSNQPVQETRKKRKGPSVLMAIGNDRLNRLASDCWELDIIGSPEVHDNKDFMHQVNSGIDYVIANACSEKEIAVEFRFSNVLDSHRRKRAQILSRMRQNVVICRHCNCDMLITSGANNKFELRSPDTLIAFGVILGMAPDEAKSAVTINPAKILERSQARADPNVILKGLKVIKWGSKEKEKKIYGWY